MSRARSVICPLEALVVIGISEVLSSVWYPGPDSQQLQVDADGGLHHRHHGICEECTHPSLFMHNTSTCMVGWVILHPMCIM